jgi:hypothetical protein
MSCDWFLFSASPTQVVTGIMRNKTNMHREEPQAGSHYKFPWQEGLVVLLVHPKTEALIKLVRDIRSVTA